jgi:hypothetical protein
MAFFAQARCAMAPARDYIVQQQSLPIRAANGSGLQEDFLTTTYSRRSSSAASTVTVPLDPLLSAGESTPSISDDSLFLSELDTLESAADTLEASDEMARQSSTQALLEGEAEDGEDTADLVVQSTTAQKLTAPTSRLHGLPDKPLTHHYQRGSLRYYVGSNRCTGLYQALTEGFSEARLMQKAIECFSITYRIDTFYPGQEPPLGTYSCPVCHVKLQQEHGKYDRKLCNSPWFHIFNCTRKVLLETAKDKLRHLQRAIRMYVLLPNLRA